LGFAKDKVPNPCLPLRLGQGVKPPTLDKVQAKQQGKSKVPF